MRSYTRTPISHVSDFMRYYTKPIISHRCRFPEILLQNHNISWLCDMLHQNHNISWLQILWNITPHLQYLMLADFVRYYTSTQYLMFHISLELRCLIVLDFMRHFIRITIYHGCRFMRYYYTRTTISHSCRFHDMLHQNHNISWMQISWDIMSEPQYPFLSFIFVVF